MTIDGATQSTPAPDRPVFIAVAGTHSTGKTTFLGELRAVLEVSGLRVGGVGDLATAARDCGFGILREHTYESTLWIITKGISMELEAGLQSDVVLVDRPVPDALGYLRAALEYRDEAVESDAWNTLTGVTNAYLGRYDLMFRTVLDKSIPIGTTKERDYDLKYRERVARCIESVFDELQIPATELHQASWPEAIERCCQTIAQNSTPGRMTAGE